MRLSARFMLPLHDEPFFSGISQAVVSRIETFIYYRKYEERQIVFFPEDPCDHVYWVREGRVKITRVSPDRRELTFRHLVPGDMIGEECLAKRPRRDDYAEALQPTVLCLMRSEDFFKLMGSEVELSHAVAVYMARRAWDIENVLAETVFSSVRSRIASGLLRLLRRQPGKKSGPIQVTHQEVANLVGSTRETATVVLHGLRDQGLIKLANRRIAVMDPAALDHIARTE
jgi:CRP/FNR family transcriptional regulator, cyclic AMP receptor protein